MPKGIHPRLARMLALGPKLWGARERALKASNSVMPMGRRYAAAFAAELAAQPALAALNPHDRKALFWLAASDRNLEAAMEALLALPEARRERISAPSTLYALVQGDELVH